MYKVYCDEHLIYDKNIESLKLFNPTLDLELNKTGAFNFVIYPNHPHYDKLQKMKSIIKVYQDSDLIFKGRILNDTQGWYNEKQINCEGELAFLVDSIQRPYDFYSGEQSTTISELFTFFINNHNNQVDSDRRFVVGEISVVDPNNYIVRADSNYTNTLDSIKNKLLDSFGGYIWITHEGESSIINYIDDFNILSTQKVEYSKNLLEIFQSTKGQDIATAIIPLGARLGEEEDSPRLTIESVNNNLDYVYNQEAVNQYGWIFKTMVWDNITIAANLKTRAEQYLATTINLSKSVELSAVDLSAVGIDVNAFKLGTYLKVTSTPHNIDMYLLVTKLSAVLDSPSKNKITLGTSFTTFTEQTSTSNKNMTSFVIQEVEGVAGQIADAIAQVEEQTSSAIIQSSEQILSNVSKNYYLKSDANTLVQSINTQFTQTNESFEMKFNEFNLDLQAAQSNTDAQFQNISKYIRFVDGNIILGEENNLLTLRIENDKISFLENDVEIAYWQNRKFYAVDGEFINSLRLGNFVFIPRANGNLSFKKVGG